jgi:hypothetical protein
MPESSWLWELALENEGQRAVPARPVSLITEAGILDSTGMLPLAAGVNRRSWA